MERYYQGISQIIWAQQQIKQYITQVDQSLELFGQTEPTDSHSQKSPLEITSFLQNTYTHTIFIEEDNLKQWVLERREKKEKKFRSREFLGPRMKNEGCSNEAARMRMNDLKESNSHIYKSMKGQDWKPNITRPILILPKDHLSPHGQIVTRG